MMVKQAIVLCLQFKYITVYVRVGMAMRTGSFVGMRGQ